MVEKTDPDVRQAAKAAAAAAAVGATVGVVRSLAARAEDAAQRQREERSDAAQQEDDDEISDDGTEDVGEYDGPQAEQSPEPEPKPEPEPEPQKGEDARTVRRVTDRAREFLQELSGADVESVSGLDRTSRGWAVMVEAVEVRRIPESTDVLATYEVELDEDGDLVRYQRLRRYARAQSDRGDA
jgi:hypothetical protein